MSNGVVDVAIVGAGPAGAWAAYRLARAGARVVIVDGSHPREKPCGGGVTGRAFAIASEALEPATVGWTAIRAARFVDSGRGRPHDVSVALGDRTLAVGSRAAFDGALADAAVRAGAQWDRARAVDVSADRTGACVTTRRGRWRADIVIGADGANSLVRRRLFQPFRRDQLSIATGVFAHGVTSDEIVLELVADPPGYIWSFPRPDHLAIGVCAQADSGADAASLRARTVEWTRAANIAPGARLEPYSWPIPSLSAADFDALAPAGPRWCLAGDAAGLVDPITREGIFFALASGGWAADAIVAHGGAFAKVYSERVRGEAGSELKRAARLKAGFFRPAFARLLMHALRESAAIRDVMADLVAGEQPYRSLKWRLLQTLEVGLALRTLKLGIRD